MIAFWSLMLCPPFLVMMIDIYTYHHCMAWLSSAQQQTLSLKAAAACMTQTKPIPLMRTRDEIGALLNREPKMFVGLELGVQRGYFAQTTLKQWKKCKKYILVSLCTVVIKSARPLSNPSAFLHLKRVVIFSPVSHACFGDSTIPARFMIYYEKRLTNIRLDVTGRPLGTTEELRRHCQRRRQATGANLQVNKTGAGRPRLKD